MCTDRMRELTGRMQVKIYCIPERDTHIYIYTLAQNWTAAYTIIASLRSTIFFVIKQFMYVHMANKHNHV